MLRILVVDDDPSKVRAISELVSETWGRTPHAIDTEGSVAEACRRMENCRYAIMVLDLLLPMRKGDDPKKDAGLALLNTLLVSGVHRRPSWIIGLTAYPDLRAVSKGRFEEDLWTLLAYDASDGDWRVKLKRLLEHAREAEARDTSGAYGCDVGIICALAVPELKAVLDLPGEWQRLEPERDAMMFHKGRWIRGDSSVSVVAAACTSVGLPWAAAAAMRLVADFRPRVLAMTGIAAGIGCAPGDILVAEQAWDYGSGKVTADGDSPAKFTAAPHALRADESILGAVHWVRSDINVAKQIRREWKGVAPHGDLRIHVGAFASGAAVVEWASLIDSLRTQNRKVVGLDMEAYSLFVAERVLAGPKPRVLVIKSASDFGKVGKDDLYQAYAAYTSAAFLRHFALRELSGPSAKSETSEDLHPGKANPASKSDSLHAE